MTVDLYNFFFLNTHSLANEVFGPSLEQDKDFIFSFSFVKLIIIFYNQL